jgi:hypothetical protein
MFIASCGEKSAPSASGGGSGRGVQADVCASDDDYTPFSLGMDATNQGLTVSIESDPPEPSPGDHSVWRLTVTNESGAPVPAGTNVSVKCLMTHLGTPAHGCPAPIHVKELGNGLYEASPVIFNMQGHWHVEFGVDTSHVPIELCVE